MTYANQIEADRLFSPYDILPISVTLDEIPVQSGNTVDRLYRYDRSNPSDAGVDISSLGSVSDNILSFTFFLASEMPATAGKYRIEGVLKDNTGTVQKCTFNYFFEVVNG